MAAAMLLLISSTTSIVYRMVHESSDVGCDAMQAADEEARLRALKAAKKEKASKRAKTGGAAFLDK